MNRYVGTTNAIPDSRTPRRLTSVIKRQDEPGRAASVCG